jgi:hypothetical protein
MREQIPDQHLSARSRQAIRRRHLKAAGEGPLMLAKERRIAFCLYL